METELLLLATPMRVATPILNGSQKWPPAVLSLLVCNVQGGYPFTSVSQWLQHVVVVEVDIVWHGDVVVNLVVIHDVSFFLFFLEFSVLMRNKYIY